MLRADPAVMRAAVHGSRSAAGRGMVAGLVVALDLEIAIRIAVYERLELPMLTAALAQEHAPRAGVELRIHADLADGADRARELQQDLLARGWVVAGHGSSRRGSSHDA